MQTRTLRSAWLTLLSVLSLTLPAWALAADIEVQTLNGERVGLTTRIQPGRWNVVMTWTTYCQVCREQYPLLSRFHETHADTDAVVLGVSLDGFDATGRVTAYRTQKRHAFPSVISSVEEFAPKYTRVTGEAFTGTPSYLFFNPEGGLVAYIDGPLDESVLEQVMTP